jgi:hAT family C-terminal dimerisation region
LTVSGVYDYHKENQHRYPTIFALAMDILPIQASAVPCERVFSSGKETMTARRNRISGELMEALQLLKFSIRQGRGLNATLNFTSGLDWDIQLEDLESDAKMHKEVPEDVPSFINNLAKPEPEAEEED